MHREIRLNVPDDVKLIIGELDANGYEAFAVGGCVRDSLMEREPADWDITTSALPVQVKEIFKRTVDTGIAHGTVTVMLGREGYEVTTYRIDGEYEDSRHPKSVEFTSNLTLDLRRRDFTINAMAYNDKYGLVDEFGGIDDLENKIIRCVGNPDERFTEDALRILRAVRFSAQLSFTIEAATADSIKRLAPTLVNISKERIHTEFNKMLLSKNPDYFVLADELGITKHVLPEFADLTMEEKKEAGMTLKRVPLLLPERYAALLMSLDSESVKKVLRGLKMDNDTISMASKLVKYINVTPVSEEIALRHLISELGRKDSPRVFDFLYAVHETESTCESYLAMKNQAEYILTRGDCVDLKGLAVTGNDLMEIGVEKGKKLGEVLGMLLETVLNDPSMNEKEKLLALIS